VTVAVAVTTSVGVIVAVAVGAAVTVAVALPVAWAVAVAVTAAVAPGVAEVPVAVGVAAPPPLPLPPGGTRCGIDPPTEPVGRTFGATLVGVAGTRPAPVVVPLLSQRVRTSAVNARSTREMSVPLVCKSASRWKAP
jgi:hypothetical protein